MSPFITCSNQLHKLHCDKSKTKPEGIYLKSSITVHVFSLALEDQTGKNMKLFCTALGLTNICLLLINNPPQHCQRLGQEEMQVIQP